MFHVKHDRKYAVYVEYLNDDGHWKKYGDNNHHVTKQTRYFYTSMNEAADVAEMVFTLWRKKEYVQMVDFVHVWEVGNDDNCASY